MSTTRSSSYGPPPHPYGQSSRQVGPVGTILVALVTTVILVAASGLLALALHAGG
jgi:hypothetical protein